MTTPPASPQLSLIAAAVGGELRGRGDLVITGINALEDAGTTEITFIADEAHAQRWPGSRAAAAIVSRHLGLAASTDSARPLILVDDAQLATVPVLQLFAPPPALPDLGVHPTAWIHPSAKIEATVRIGPHVSVDRQAHVCQGVTLHPGVRIYPDVQVGAGTVIHGNCVIRERCRVGAGVTLHPNVTVGADGFGYQPDPKGAGLIKVPQNGIVIIEDGVEIGAGTCIDRGKFGATIIGAGSKIDNLVQIGHNCRIGRSCVIAGNVGLSGSVIVEDGAIIAGGVGVADHVRIGRGARIGAMSGVMRDVPAGTTHLGYPSDDAADALRQWAAVRKLPGLLQRLARRESAGA